MPDIRLDGKVALVTGATGGWGSGAAIALASRGAAVVLNARTRTKLDGLADRLNGWGGTAVAVAGDIRSLEGASRIVDETVDRCGRLDILVNSAGMTVTDAGSPADGQASGPGIYGGELLGMTYEAWVQVIDTELTGVFTCTQAAARQMVAQGDGGSVVTVIGTYLGAPGESAHGAAKSGVLSAIWSWSEELKEHRITVNGVRGYVRSLLTDRAGFNTDDYDFQARRGSGQIPTEPVDAGELVAWLASADAVDVTGAYIGIDGPRITFWEPRLPDTAVFRYPHWTAEEIAQLFGPIVRRRPPRPGMVNLVKDLFSERDLKRADEAAKRYASDRDQRPT
jgi:NAD(P)-dependent dehydrogenase (short-subunit alcohol dehydrogenase family)